jgi:predicted AAA+ superfamily ATPase
MVERIITEKLKDLLNKFPVVSLTGPRQSGKSTLLRNQLPGYDYVSLEEPDVRLFAKNDPRGFLQNYKGKTIIDEAQYVPQLFSYIQTITDTENTAGRFVLSGSQNFLLMQSISQSLAGRVAILKLLPFSYSELYPAAYASDSLNNCLFTGGYPRIFDKRISPAEFYPNYVHTYVERDVRLLRNIPDLSMFIRFLKLCAGRIGQLLNIASLANECGISGDTARAWLSVLETSYIAFLVQPYYKNFNKRLVKTPKLYFHDTGLACSLLGIETEKQMETHYLRGELFENWVISEYFKQEYATGREPSVYFWRDSNGVEVDLLIEKAGELSAVEIKSGSTLNSDYFKGLKQLQQLNTVSTGKSFVVYGGTQAFETSKGRFIPWNEWGQARSF